MQVGGIDLESSHKHKKQHANLEHGVTPHGNSTSGWKEPCVGVGCERAQDRWPQENSPKQLAQDCWLAQGTHDLATDECRREHRAYLESKHNHIVVLHTQAADIEGWHSTQASGTRSDGETCKWDLFFRPDEHISGECVSISCLRSTLSTVCPGNWQSENDEF